MLIHFLQTLSATGRAQLPWPGREVSSFIREAGSDPHDRHQSGRLLAEWHAIAVADLAGEPLPFHANAALWGAKMTFRAAALICFREAGEETIPALMGDQALLDSDSPAAHFSADLCLRHWTDLATMARRLSEDDPLVKAMHALAANLPLAAVGLEISLPAAHCIYQHSGLRGMLAERAMERADHTALTHPVIHSTLQGGLGAYAITLGRGILPSALPQ